MFNLENKTNKQKTSHEMNSSTIQCRDVFYVQESLSDQFTSTRTPSHPITILKDCYYNKHQ